ncbi:Zn-ribbon domain-containing OB-fold protein [Streptomyces gilvus]|uniref:Zn-ribbon domain-containing OB-fold protein n=1 Tax=Streptomyces gilvus TaxID=2920937 RepID=UPI001F0FDCBC|nr:OB-fold domain-containing protein [Streptomyces sp. CME 23]MCH5675653.1 OB-fold domain-containing protein [Streptomyces sp. CME 23]
MILPIVDGADTAPFWDAAREGQLVVQSCGDCGLLRFPPGPVCSHCRSARHEWTPVSGDAVIWSFVVAHGPTLPEYAEYTPFPLAVVTLAEGPQLRMVGNVLSGQDARLNSFGADDLAIGDPVRVAFRKLADDVSIPVWVPALPAPGD